MFVSKETSIVASYIEKKTDKSVQSRVKQTASRSGIHAQDYRRLQDRRTELGISIGICSGWRVHYQPTNKRSRQSRFKIAHRNRRMRDLNRLFGIIYIYISKVEVAGLEVFKWDMARLMASQGRVNSWTNVRYNMTKIMNGRYQVPSHLVRKGGNLHLVGLKAGSWYCVSTEYAGDGT